MDISEEQMEVYRRSARQRERVLRAQIKERHQRAWELARQAAMILKEEFGATRVVVYGSLIHPQRFHLRSDIDLAVWDVQHYFRALARLLDLDSSFDFDLVPIEDARPGVLKTITEEGVDL